MRGLPAVPGTDILEQHRPHAVLIHTSLIDPLAFRFIAAGLHDDKQRTDPNFYVRIIQRPGLHGAAVCARRDHMP